MRAEDEARPAGQEAAVATQQEEQQSLPVLAISCGGTGGHFYPGLTIAEAYRQRGGQAVLMIGGRHVPQQLAQAREAGLAAYPVPVARLPASRLALPLFALRLGRCVRASRRRLREVGAGAVLAMGSFASVPVGLAAAWRRLPLFLHEGNAVPGRANRLLSRWARACALTFPLATETPTRARQEVVGFPLRRAILEAGALDPADRGQLRAELGLDPERATLMAFGGSQGAHRLNELVRDAVGLLAGTDLQVIHLTGESWTEDLGAVYRDGGVKALVQPREAQIERLLQAADFVVCRAGAASLCELAVMGKPALMIPFPEATDNHQVANAQHVVAAGGGYLLEQAAATPEKIADTIGAWLRDPEARQQMGRNMQSLARPHAAAGVIDLILAELAGAP